MADDGFSVENLRVKDLPPLDPAVAKPRRQQQREFVMVTRTQFDRLSQASCAAAERVFLHLLFLTWRPQDRGKPKILANAAPGEWASTAPPSGARC